MVAQRKEPKLFGEYHNNLDALAKGEEAARILTLRAAHELGVYRPYTSRSLTKDVQNGQITVAYRVGTVCFYDKKELQTMSIQPNRGRKPLSVEQIRAKLKEATIQAAELRLELDTVLSESSGDATPTKESERQQRAVDRVWVKAYESVRRWTDYLALAEEAQAACDAHWAEYVKILGQAPSSKATSVDERKE